MKMSQAALICFFLFLITACQSQAATSESEISAPSTAEDTTASKSFVSTEAALSTLPSSTIKPEITKVLVSATPDTRTTPKYWREWPVIPTLSNRAFAILRDGIQKGNDIHSFSRIGDCQSEPAVFLGIYASDQYSLPAKYPSLPETIRFFYPSFNRVNATAKKGYGVSTVLSTLFNDPNICQGGENLLDCELRRNKPIVAFIAMGTNWQPNSSAKFEQYLRQIVDRLIEAGTLPIIVTKPDNIEGDWLLDRAMSQVAYDYDLPLVNAWRAVQYLPNHGLQKDLTYMVPTAWDERNLAALRTLDAVRQEISSLRETAKP